MSEKRYSGNIISSTPVEPDGAFESSAASGVWSLAEAFAYTKAGLWPTAGNAAQIGLFAGGLTTATPTVINTIDQVTIPSLGNATDFGDLTAGGGIGGGAGSQTRGLIAGGYAAGDIANGTINVIQYVTFASAGNSTDFGDLNNPVSCVGSSNATRALFSGGGNTSPTITSVNNIDYVTIASTGNATNFGDLTVAVRQHAGMASPTRALAGGGFITGATNVISYVTIASTGNAIDFGDLLQEKAGLAACASSTRGLFCGGGALTVIDYVTIASAGNATDFGDLTQSFTYTAATSSETRGLVATNGYTSGHSNVINYVTIASAGNATDFGDLTLARGWGIGLSNVHGGLS